MPSVFSMSSTPEKRERSQRPATRLACAWGTLRASARSSAIVCSAAVTTFDCGAFATTMPCLVAAPTSALSTPTPARPMTRRLRAPAMAPETTFAAERSRMPSDAPGIDFSRRADQDSVVAADALGELLVGPVRPEVDVEVLAQQLDAGIAD